MSCGAEEEDEALAQLRAQFVYLVLCWLAYLSALSVIGRPLSRHLAYDEMISSVAYALLSSAAGLHAVTCHLLTRNDVCRACCSAKSAANAASSAQEADSNLRTVQRSLEFLMSLLQVRSS